VFYYILQAVKCSCAELQSL